MQLKLQAQMLSAKSTTYSNRMYILVLSSSPAQCCPASLQLPSLQRGPRCPLKAPKAAQTDLVAVLEPLWARLPELAASWVASTFAAIGYLARTDKALAMCMS